MKHYKPSKRVARDGTRRGRPRTAMSEAIVRILEDEFKIVSDVTTACHKAKITRELYYDELRTSPEFAYRMNSAQMYLDRKARSALADAISVKNNWSASLAWLRHRNRRYMPAEKHERGSNIVVSFGSVPSAHPFLNPDDLKPPSSKISFM